MKFSLLYQPQNIKTESFKLFLVFFFVMISGFSFTQEIGSPIITNYSPKEYNFHPQNWSIVKDKRGVLYFGNTKGILEFDGTNWRKIFVENDYMVRSLAIDNYGTIYVGATGAFGFLAPDSLGNMQYNSISTNYDTNIIKTVPDIWRIRILNNEVYFNGLNAIYKYSPYKKTGNINEKIRAIYPPNRFVLSYAINDKLFIQEATKGLSILQCDTLKTILKADKLPGNIVFAMIPDINENNPEEILIALNNRLLKYNPIADTSKGESIFSHFRTEADDFFIENAIYDAIKLPGERFAIASLSKGIIIIDYQGNIVDIVNAQNNLQDETVWSLAYFDNSLWLALNNGIAQVEITSPFRFWDKNNGLKGLIEAIIRYNKIIYFASTEGIFYYDTVFNKTLGDIPISRQIEGSSNESWCFLKYFDKDSNDTLLLVGQSRNLFEIAKNNKTKDISSSTVFCLLQSSFNPDIIYGGGGVSLIILKRNHQKNTWDIDEIEGFDGEIRSIAELDNELWLTTFFNGVFRLKLNSPGNFFNAKTDEYEVSHYTTAHGFKGIKDIMVYKIDNELIFTSPDGIYKYDQDKNHFLPYDKFGKIFQEGKLATYRFIQNNKGNIWVDDYGILYKQNNATYFFDTIFSKRIPFIQLSGIYPDKNLWYAGGSDGVFRYDKQNDYNYEQKFNTIIRKVTIKNDSVVFYGTYFQENDSSDINIYSAFQPGELKPVINYKYNTLIFEYSSTFFISPKSTLYSYKLDGFDEDWSLWTKETKKEYTNLPEGNYVFYVKAKNIYEFESKTATYEFEILPPLFRTWWAYTSYVVLLIILIWIIVKINIRQHVKAKIRLEEIVTERTAEISQQKEEIQMQSENLFELNEEITKKNEELSQQNEEIQIQSDYLVDLNSKITEKNTKLSQQKEEIEAVAKKLKIANNTKDKFFSIIAHDLKSPFSSILGFMEILNNEYDSFDEPDRKQFINHVFNDAKHIYNLILNLLSWARTQTDHISYNPLNLDLSALIEDNISLLQSSADHKEITINMSFPEKVTIYADPEMISTVVRNILSNAIKFTPKKGKIEIGSKGIINNKIKIFISDSGVGIKKEDIQKLFNLSETHSTRGTNNEKGTGLGLLICKEFIEKNNGEIWVESTKGEGSVFYFTIPYNKNKKEIIMSKTEKPVSRPEIEIKKLKILIAEDVEAADKHLSILLKKISKEILHAKTGKDTVMICQNNPDIDLVLMDIHMPEMNGYDATQKIREFNKDVVIIAQTAYAMRGDREKALEAGCNDYISKPIKKDKLLEMIHKLFSN